MKRGLIQIKWVISLCLAIMLVLQTLPISAYAESTEGDAGTAIMNDASSSNEIGQMESGALLEQTARYTVNMRSNSNASENGWIKQNAMVEGIVEWQVEITAVDANDFNAPMPLHGLKFYNLLDHSKQGTYIDGSFEVNGVAVLPDSGTTNELSYTFTAETGNKAKIIYRTWIPKSIYYHEYNAGDSSWETISNKAELRDASNTILASSNSWRIAVKPDWIRMSATLVKRANPADPRNIVWTIDVNKNYNKQALKEFNIKTPLPAGLTFKSAAYQLWDSQTNDWAAKKPIWPDASDVYAFGEVNGGIRLVIESEVAGTIKNFTNKATAEWKLDSNSVQDNDQATVADTANVVIGNHTLVNKGTVTDDDFNIGATTWTVDLTPQEALPFAALYSLLVYDGAIDLEQIDDNPQVSKEVLRLLKQKGSTTREYWQKYKQGSFASENGLQLEVIPLMQNGIQVADLLRVTGYDSVKKATFTFRSVQNHPDKFARQEPENDKTRYNRVHLIDGNEYEKYSEGNVSFYGRMLNNELLYASIPEGSNVTPNSVESYLGNDNSEKQTLAAYDQVTNTVTFRLAVNMTGLKTDEMALDGGNRVASDIRLVNTLPEGWEFVPFSAEKDFELWLGESSNSAAHQYGMKNNAKTIIEPLDSHHVASFSSDGNVGTFHFTKLESPYVILVKARPTQDTLQKYAMSGQTKVELYNTADLHMKWGNIATVRTDQRKVIVPVNEGQLPGNLTLITESVFVLGDGNTSIQLTASLRDYKDDAVANTEVVFTLPDQSEQKSTTDVQGKATITYTVPKLVGDQQETHTITALVNSPTEGQLTASTSVIVIPAVIGGIVQGINDKTGAGIENVEVTLYYADTPRNQTNGIVADEKVTLPVLSGFAPNDNASPSQNSDLTGSYAYMVYPNTDYYLIATRSGYVTYRSSIISVGYNIVDYNIKMKPENSGGGNGNGGTLPEPASIVNMMIDGVNHSTLITSQIVQTNGESTAVVKFNEQKLLDMLATKKMDVLTLSAESDVHALVGNLSGRLLDALAANGALLELKKGRATYSLPSNVLDILQVTKSLQADNDLESIMFTIKISETTKEKAEIARTSATAAGLTIAAEPIDFDIEAQYGDKRMTVNQFSGFVKRTLSVLDRVDATATLTGALIDEQGNLLPVPTRTVTSNGTRYAVISSMTNSTYVLVQGKKTFSDLSGHWSQKDVSEMAARLVVHGVDKYRYAPDRAITRAEFAAIMIRALGLNLTYIQEAFKDVQDFKDIGAADWYADHVIAASALGLIKGYEDGTFRPNQIITRSEASVILMRALELAQIATAMSEDEANMQLGDYMDADKTPEWGKRFLAAAIKEGIIQGDKQQRLIPEGLVTRAQAAVMIKRLLQRAELIDK